MSRFVVLAVAATLAPATARAQTPPPEPPASPAPPAPAEPPAPPAPPPTESPAPPPPTDDTAEPAKAQITGGGEDNGEFEETEDLKDGVTYKPGKGMYLRSNGAQVRLKTIVEPALRLAYINCAATTTACPDVQTIYSIRRARLGFDTKLPHDLEVNVEFQVKNLLFGLTHFYGAWSPDPNHQLVVGFIKGPGNLERDIATWHTPFVERSVVTDWLSRDREMGIMLVGATEDRAWRYELAVGKPVPKGLDGAEAEDRPPPRPGAIDADDSLKGAGQINVDGRIAWTPNKHLSIGASAGVRFRPDGDAGDNVAEPFDTSIADAHQYTGTMMRGTLDLAVRGKHWRLIAEAGGRRDGKSADQNADGTMATGRTYGYVGEVTFGYGPHAKYGAAARMAPLKKGWEWVSRVEGASVHQPGNIQDPGFRGTARFLGAISGINWQAHKQLRLQVDVSYEKFGDDAFGVNAGATRVWAQLWGFVRL